jgi:arylsulfatase A-like enzyme
LLAGSVLAACAVAYLALGGFAPCVGGEKIRLIDALDKNVVLINPLSGPIDPTPSPPPKKDGMPLWQGLEKSLSIATTFAEAGQARIRSLAIHAHMAGEARAALVCAPRTLLRYRLRLPAAARLRFGLGKSLFKARKVARQGYGVPTRLTIKVHRLLRPTRTVFALDVNTYKPDGLFRWKDFLVPLEAFAGQRITLTIEAETVKEGPGPRVALYVAEPTIAPDSPATPDRPNVVILAADALRADHLACYGYGRPTSPNIDRLSRDAVLFENAISQASWTLPSFASLFTSLYPSFHGANLMARRLLPVSPTLTATLEAAGYTTAGCVRSLFLLPRRGIVNDFDLYYGKAPRTEDQLPVIAHWLETIPSRPFFLFVHMLVPHSPYEPPAPYAGRFQAPGVPRTTATSDFLTLTDKKNGPLTPAELDSLRASYDENILYFDSAIGKILEDLRRAGAEANSLIILTSDHGEQFREHGRLMHGKSLYQEEIHVPLVLKLPGGRGPRGLRVADRVRGIDILPTILDFLGLATPGEAQGRSLLPLVRGKALPEQTVFSELHTLRQTALLHGPFKYVTGDRARRDRKIHPAGTWEALYDLEHDPGETRDIISERPRERDFFRAEAGAFAERAAAFRKRKALGPKANDLAPSKKDVEKLRALGYVR